MPLKKKKKTKVKKKVTKKVIKTTKIKKKITKKVKKTLLVNSLKKIRKNLLSKQNLSGLKAVQLQKANIKKNIRIPLKITMSSGEKKEKELLG